MRNPFARDLILLHAPAVYDFRTRAAFWGPVADAVPSTSMFEMYPVGLTSLAAFLERNHYNVEIVNLAYRMLRDPGFDVPAAVAALHAPVFGIDLHWLPHVQGALAVADLVKQLHPKSLVLMGGLSASYYHEELARNPSVDFVLRGDSTEEPARQLLQALRESRPLDGVANLTWKRPDGSVVVNPLSFVPERLDDIDIPAYDYLLRSVFKYRSLRNLVPSFEWLQFPITLLLTARGCTQNCVICGGSSSAYARICHRGRPAFRSPEKLLADVRTIASFSRAPIFVVHDIRMAGAQRAVQFLSMLEQERPSNEMIFELYYPAGDEFFGVVERSVPSWSAEITLESPDEDARRVNGKFPYSNADVEATIASALAHGCRKLDVFFMVGLPHQRPEDARRIPVFCDRLLRRFGGDGRLRPFVAPLGPFLDPGSRAFEEPSFGYTRLCTTLEDHRRAFLQDGWNKMLSFETDAMTRDELVRTTYEVAGQLNDLNRRYRVIDERTWTEVELRLQSARSLLVDEAQGGTPLDPRRMKLANRGTMFDSDELKWPGRRSFRAGFTLLAILLKGLVVEAHHTSARLLGHYDTAPIS